MLIRQINDQDRGDWLRMRRQLWPDLPPDRHRAEMNELFADPARAVFVALRPDGGLGGFLETSQRKYADGCFTSPVGYIEGWYIDPDLRRQSLGEQLIWAAETWAREQGLQEMASDCLINNEISLIAHTALGYQEVERLIHFKKHI